MRKLLAVKDILNDYFTEEHVDFSTDDNTDRGTFVIWFPQVTVSNESGLSTDVYDLFVRLRVSCGGTLLGTFEMGKTTYTETQFLSSYLHSHCCGYPEHGVDRFYSCCLGRGPLVRTVSTLAGTFDENIWRLFCAELDLYTKTESVEGVPYRYISSIGGSRPVNINFSTNIVNDTSFSYLFEKTLEKIVEDHAIPFTYDNGSYTIAMPPVDLVIKLSEYLLSVYNTDPYFRIPSNKCLRYRITDCVLRDGKLYSTSNGYNRAYLTDDFSDTYINFKGDRKQMNILPRQDEEDTNLHALSIVDTNVLSCFISPLLGFINTKFNVNAR